MKIHVDNLTAASIRLAARKAGVSIVNLTEHGSRKATRAFNVNLEGDSNRRPNRQGARDNMPGGTGFAATWDQWGVFLSVLFDIDPLVSTPYDTSASAFHVRTADRFNPDNPDNRANPDGFWPADAHGDHRFEYVGRPRQQSCKHCTATVNW